MRFGAQLDMAGIIAPSADADRAVRYLTKYLTKSVAAAHLDDDDEPDPAYRRHVDRLHAELRWLPCSPRCANWLRYGIQPDQAGPGLEPGFCDGPAHDRENLGLGGRRVLVSRQWSGKTLGEHRADRATVVREALLAAGIVAPEVERMAATVTLPDGTPRFVWTDSRPDPAATSGCCSPRSRSGNAGGPSTRPRKPRLWITRSATRTGHRDRPPNRTRSACWRADHTRPHPMTSRSWSEERLSRVSAANPQDTKCP